MLRITTVTTHRQIRLVLEGKLAAPWVAELVKAWIELRTSAGDQTIVVDLKGVTMIGEDGEQALFEMMCDSVKFLCSGVLNKHVLRRLKRKSRELDLHRTLSITRKLIE